MNKINEQNDEIKSDLFWRNDRIERSKKHLNIDWEKLENRPDKHIFVLTDEYVDKIQQKTWILNDNQRIQLEIAFLITQQAFSRKMRKDGSTPYFKHIKWVLDGVLMLDKVSFEQVMISILHDNLEDINHHTYDMLRKLFGRKIAEWVLALTEKKWYHRIWFLPQEQRAELQSIINYFVWLGKMDYLDEEKIIEILDSMWNKNPEEVFTLPWAENFVKKYNKISKKNFEWLKEKDTLPPTVESDFNKMLKNSEKFYDQFPYGFYDKNFRSIFQVSKAISEYRYLDKKLNVDMFEKTDELLAIKFSDRIHNLSTLRWKKEDWETWDFSKPSKRVAKLLETEYHFTDRKNKNQWKDEKTLEERLSNLKIKQKTIYENEENILPWFFDDRQRFQTLKEKFWLRNYTHYDILKNQLDIIRNNDSVIKKICEWENSLYDQAKQLYWNQIEIIKKIEKLRDIERENKWLNSEQKPDLKKYYEKLVKVIGDLDWVYEKMDKDFNNNQNQNDKIGK